MTIAEKIAETTVVVQFIKTAAARIGIKIEGTWAIVLTCIAAAGIEVYDLVQSGGSFTYALIVDWIQVCIGAMGGYGLIKVAGGAAAEAARPA